MLDIRRALAALIERRQLGKQSQSPGDPLDLLSRDILAFAERDPSGLPSAILGALSEAAKGIDRVSIAVTGLAWLGSGAPSVQQEMMALVRSARREIAVCAYSVTAAAIPFLAEIREAVVQGAHATIVINDFLAQPPDVQAFLKHTLSLHPKRWRLFDFDAARPQTELHAKVIVVDRATALIGSANLSFHGMVSNHELAVVVRGPTAERIAERMDLLSKVAHLIGV